MRIPSKLGLQLGSVSVQSSLELSKCRGLDLICVLQTSDPLGLFALKSGDLPLDLHSLLILLVDLPDEFLSLLLALVFFLHHAHLDSLVLLVPHHLFHALGFQSLGPLLNLDHLLVLLSFGFQALSLAVVLLGLGHLLHSDGLLLVVANLLIL